MGRYQRVEQRFQGPSNFLLALVAAVAGTVLGVLIAGYLAGVTGWSHKIQWREMPPAPSPTASPKPSYKLQSYVGVRKGTTPENIQDHDFTRRWRAVWPDMPIVFVEPRKHINKLEDLFDIFLHMLDLAEASDADAFMLFEGDAIPFPGVNWPDDVQTCFEELPGNALLYTGTHSEHPVRDKIRVDIEKNILAKGRHIYQINYFSNGSPGTYGLALHRSFIPILRARWMGHYEPGGFQAVDHGLSRLRRFVATPLLVDHPARNSYDRWPGFREWWLYPTRKV